MDSEQPNAPTTLVQDLPDDLTSLASVRRWAGAALTDLTEDDLDDCMLVVTELVSNAYDHGSGPRRVRLRRSPGACLVRIEVDDTSPERPALGRSRLSGTRGRGLVIVDRVSKAWGVDPRPGGKTVWAELATSAPAHARR